MKKLKKSLVALLVLSVIFVASGCTLNNDENGNGNDTTTTTDTNDNGINDNNNNNNNGTTSNIGTDIQNGVDNVEDSLETTNR